MNAIHLSLEVPDLAQAVEFYRKLFLVEPAKLQSDYAVFDLADPPLVLALQPGGSAVSHLGVRVQSIEEVELTSSRLRESGMSTLDERDLATRYGREDKVWVRDPAGHRWEIFAVL